MAIPRLLDDDVLDALDAWVIERGAGRLLGERIHRLDATEVERLAEASGVPLSVEARRWWQRYGGGGSSHVDLLPGLARLSLPNALANYAQLRSIGAEEARTSADIERVCDPELWWNAAWLPIFLTGSRDIYAIDARVPDGAPSPVLQIDWERISQDDYDTPVAASLGSFVCDRMDEYAKAGWRYDGNVERWVVDR